VHRVVIHLHASCEQEGIHLAVDKIVDWGSGE